MARRPDIPALTGLRGVAVLLVVNVHYFFWCAPFDWRTWPRPFEILFATDDLGMTLFFTLSGFVIAYNYLHFDWSSAPLQSAVRFLYLRFARLYPALLLFLFVMMPVARSQLGHAFPRMLQLQIFSAESWYPVKMGGALPSNIGFNVSWSISTEVGMYLIFVAAMIAIPRLGRRIAIAIGTAYMAAIVALMLSPRLFESIASLLPVAAEQITPQDLDRWFFYLSPFFHIVDFAAGAAAALLVMSGAAETHRDTLRSSVMIVLAALLLGHVLWAGFRLNIGAHLRHILEIVGFALIMVNAEDRTRFNAVLMSPPLLFLGRISYSLYLFHILFPRFFVENQISAYSLGALPHFIINYTVTLLFATAFSYGMLMLIEDPARKALRGLTFRHPKVVAASSARSGAPLAAQRESHSTTA